MIARIARYNFISFLIAEKRWKCEDDTSVQADPGGQRFLRFFSGKGSGGTAKDDVDNDREYGDNDDNDVDDDDVLGGVNNDQTKEFELQVSDFEFEEQSKRESESRGEWNCG